MKDDWKERLFAAIDGDQRSDRAISLAAGLGPNFISQMRGTKSAAPKKPNIEYVRKLAKALGKDLSTILGDRHVETETALRSALLAYGVDGEELDQVIRVIGTYVSADETQEQRSLEDQSLLSNPRREEEPLPRLSLRSSS